MKFGVFFIVDQLQLDPKTMSFINFLTTPFHYNVVYQTVTFTHLAIHKTHTCKTDRFVHYLGTLNSMYDHSGSIWWITKQLISSNS